MSKLFAANLMKLETIAALAKYWDNYDGPEAGNGMGYVVAGSIAMLAQGMPPAETPAYDTPYVWTHNGRTFDQWLLDEAKVQREFCDDDAPMAHVWDDAIAWLGTRVEKGGR